MTLGEKIVSGLLGVLLVMCFVIVVLGGYVRLSGSGLSIPEWPFFTIETNALADGSIEKRQALFPPTTEEAWKTLRETYLDRVPPGNVGYVENVSMEQFQRMFWIEWGHRGVAKAIGALYLIFLGCALAFREVRERIGGKAAGAMLLLIVQAFLGAWVVFEHLPAEKVAVHLTVAFLFTSGLLWMLMELVHKPAPADKRTAKNPMLRLSVIVYLIVLLQIFSGGLMAGSMAGFQWNTWPKMGDYWIPPNMMNESWGLFKNLLENKIVIQFTHRWFAFAALGAVLFLVLRAMTVQVSKPGRWALRAVFGLAVFQVLLGIMTLVTGVHTHLALTHQAVGLLLLLNVLVVCYETATQPVLAEEELARLAEQQEGQPVSPPGKEAIQNA